MVKSLPANYYNGWSYPGTVALIQTAKLPDGTRRALLDLCGENFWYSPKEADLVIADNRATLAPRD